MLIAAAAGSVLPSAGVAAGLDRWMPYDLAEVKTLLPSAAADRDAMTRQFLMPGYRRIEPAAPARLTRASRRPTSSGEPASARAGRLMRQPPTAYVLTAERSGVPAWLLYGVALQESQLAFGHETVPFPWTLCVRGRGERHPSYQSVRDALRSYLRQGITNVDCGAMQVNWHYHSDKLQSVERALDPYPNLAVGAAILKAHYQDTGDWCRAVGLYHTGVASNAERLARAARYAAGVARRLALHGQSMEQVIAHG